MFGLSCGFVSILIVNEKISRPDPAQLSALGVHSVVQQSCNPQDRCNRTSPIVKSIKILVAIFAAK